MRFSRETFWGLFHLINNQMVAAVRGEGPVSLPSETVPTPLLFLSFSFILLSVNVYNSGACRTDSVPCKKPEWMTTRDCAGLVFLLSCSIVVLFQTHHDSDEKVKKKRKKDSKKMLLLSSWCMSGREKVLPACGPSSKVSNVGGQEPTGPRGKQQQQYQNQNTQKRAKR